MTPDDRDTDEAKDRNAGFVRTVVSSLFETIADMDERNQRRRSATGSARRGDTRFDFGFDVGLGPETETETGTETRRVEADTDYAASVSELAEGYVVTLDLPDIDPRGLAAGVDENGQLVVADDDRVLERVSLPDGDLEVGEASFNNGILDVRLNPTGGDG